MRGPPAKQRMAKSDEVQAQDINWIVAAVRSKYSAKQSLPGGLPEMELGFHLNDPETKKAYEYRTVDEKRFELCAAFQTDTRAAINSNDGTSHHGVGRTRFVFPE